jgi:Glycosyl transferase family 11
MRVADGHVVALLGGLGNQLFQIAFGERLAQACGAPTLYDVCGRRNPAALQLLPQLACVDTCHQTPALSPLGRMSRIGNVARRFTLHRSAIRDVSLGGIEPTGMTNPRYWCGYWQRPEHLLNVPHLRSNLSRNLTTHDAWLRDLRRSYPGEIVVAMHVRRGDYAASTPLLARNYYRSAHELLLSRLGVTGAQAVLAVVTDDPDWVSSEFRMLCPMVVSRGTSAFSDLATLAFADARVLSHSTYSWWAASLGPRGGSGTTVCPVPWALGNDLSDAGAPLRVLGWWTAPAEYEFRV